jgi:phage pi2 protein 07
MTHYFLLAPLMQPSLIIDGFVLYPLKKLKGWMVNL